MITWPISQNRLDIPAKIMFTPNDFSTDIHVRSLPIQNFWYSDDSIILPLPNILGTNTGMKYSSDLGAVSNAHYDINRLKIAEGSVENVRSSGGLRRPGKIVVDSSGKIKQPNIPSPPTTDLNVDVNENYLDMVDTTWMGMNRRAYLFNFLLICKSVEDSITASAICNRFDSYSLSILRKIGNKDEVPSGQHRSYHPPMWGISVLTLLNPDSNAATANWLGYYPQLSVLAEVRTMRHGGNDPNSIHGIGINTFVPLTYSIELKFVELEPVYQSFDGDMVQSRSQFWDSR